MSPKNRLLVSATLFAASAGLLIYAWPVEPANETPTVPAPSTVDASAERHPSTPGTSSIVAVEAAVERARVRQSSGRNHPAMNPDPMDAMARQFSLHPEFAQKYVEAYKEALRARYWLFFRQQGASEEQIQRFISTMSQWRTALTDLDAAAKEVGSALAQADLDHSRKSMTEARDQELKAIFGNDGPQRLSQFRNTGTQRDTVEEMMGPAFGIGEPLTVKQTEMMVNLLTQAEVSVKREGGVSIYPSDATYEAFFKSAGQFLSENQLGLLRDIYSNRRATIERARGLRR